MPAVKTYTAADLETVIIEALSQIAPEADFDDLEADEDLREALDIDSFDFLNFLIGLNEALGVEIPEADYGRVNTMQELTTYLLAKLKE